jgi:4-methyl-5(b-hydroxyethyl)-thiazole monophosphate biosynthesis
MKTALVLLAPGFEEIEAVTIIDILRRAGISVTVAGLEPQWVTGSHQIAIKPDIFYKEAEPSAYDLLILPGGQPGSTNLKNDPLVLEWIQNRFRAGKSLAAICAAPTVFHAAGITEKITVTSYPSEKNVFNAEQYSEQAVVKDHGVITSRGVGTAIPFALELVKELAGKTVAETVKTKILFDTFQTKAF